MPPPNVDSIVVKLMQRETPLVSVDDEETFFKLVKALLRKDVKQSTTIIRISLKKKHKESILNGLNKQVLILKDAGKRYQYKILHDCMKKRKISRIRKLNC